MNNKHRFQFATQLVASIAISCLAACGAQSKSKPAGSSTNPFDTVVVYSQNPDGSYTTASAVDPRCIGYSDGENACTTFTSGDCQALSNTCVTDSSGQQTCTLGPSTGQCVSSAPLADQNGNAITGNGPDNSTIYVCPPNTIYCDLGQAAWATAQPSYDSQHCLDATGANVLAPSDAAPCLLTEGVDTNGNPVFDGTFYPFQCETWTPPTPVYNAHGVDINGAPGTCSAFFNVCPAGTVYCGSQGH